MSVNEYRGESEVTIPAEFLEGGGKTDIILPLRFTHSSYVQLEKLTGVKHFARLQNFDSMLGEEFIVFALFAGTRRTRPSVTLNQLNEWLDAVPPSKLPQVFKEVQSAFMLSMSGPPKGEVATRRNIELRLQKIDPKKLEAALEALNSPVYDKSEGEPETAGPLEPMTMTTNLSSKTGSLGLQPA